MSAPMRMTAQQVRYLADVLEAMTKVTKQTGARIDGYGPVDVQVGDTYIKVQFDSDEGYDGEYVVNDRVGD